MSALSPEATKLRAGITQAANQAVPICRRFEQGQGETPLGDQVRSVVERTDSSSSSVLTLLGFTPEAAGDVLQLISTEPGLTEWFKSASADFDIMEVIFGSEWTLYPQDSNSVRLENLKELETALHLLSAKAKGRHKGGECSLQFQLPAARNWHQTRILVVCDVKKLAACPQVLTRIVTASNLLLLAGRGDFEPGPEDRRMLEEILPGLDALLPLVTSTPCEGAWWNDKSLLLSTVVIPAVMLPEEGATGEPLAGISDPDAPLRAALRLHEQSSRLRSVTELIAVRCDREIKQLAQRQEALLVSEKDLEERTRGRDVRAELDYLKTDIEDGLSRIVEGIENCNRQLVQRRGRFTSMVRDMVESVDISSLQDTKGAKTVRKALDPRVTEEMLRTLTQALRRQLSEDAGQLRDGLATVGGKIEQGLSKSRGVPTRLTIPEFQEATVWKHLQGELFLEVRSDFEVARQGGVMFFLGESRKVIMPLFMTLSMFGISRGGMFEGNAVLGRIFMLFGFILAGLYAVSEHKKEQAERVVKEVEKIRDILATEANRVVTDIQRDKTVRIAAYMGDLRKTLIRKAEEMLRQSADARTQQLDRERRELKTKAKTLEQRQKELLDCGKQICKVQAAANDLAASAGKLLTDSSRPQVAATARERR